MKWELKPLGEIITENKKSKLKVRDSNSEGRYIFFTSGRATNFTDEALIDGENLFVATGGAANVSYHKGPASYSTDCYSFSSATRTNTKYLYYFLTKNLPKINTEMFKGAALKHLQKKLFKALLIPLPPLEEQKRIAGILDAADALRAKRRESLVKLDDLLQSTFLDLFGGTSVSKNWKTETVEKVAIEQKGAMRTGPFGSQLLHSEFVDQGIKVLGIDNVVTNSFKVGNPKFITLEKYQDLKRYTVLPGDVLITIMGTCGRCAVVPEGIDTAINTKHLCCITLDQSKCLPSFLHGYFLRHPIARDYLKRKAKGAIMAGLNMGIIKSLPIPLPPLDLQQRFAKIVSSVEEQKAKMRKHLEQLDDLFASLQQRAFRGDL